MGGVTISFEDFYDDFYDEELEKRENDNKIEKKEKIYTSEQLEKIEDEIIKEVKEEYDDDFEESDDANDDVFDESDDEEYENNEDDEYVEDDDNLEKENTSEKKSYPSIDKMLKETKSSPYFVDCDIEFNKHFNDMVFSEIEMINEKCEDNLEKEVILTYSIIHDMTEMYLNRRNEILNSSECIDVYKKFLIYKEVLCRKRKRYLEDLADANIKTVYYVANKFRGNSDFDELVSVGMYGYSKALDKYSPVRGIKFATFAIHCIYNEILFYLRKEKKIQQNSVSINTKLSTDKNGNDLIIEDIIPDYRPNPAESLSESNVSDTIKKSLGGLSATERFIIIYRYGIDRGIILTQKDIATKLDMSQANISKIEKNSLEKLEEILSKQDF